MVVLKLISFEAAGVVDQKGAIYRVVGIAREIDAAGRKFSARENGAPESGAKEQKGECFSAAQEPIA